MQGELRRVGRYVERALLAAKAERQALIPDCRRLTFSRMLGEIVDDYALLAADRELEMQVRMFPELEVHCDPDLLRQLLHSLLENAVRYAD